MNSDRIEGNWHQIVGTVKEKWGKLTDDDLKVIEGSVERLVGKVQERYGIALEEAHKQVEAWQRIQKEGGIPGTETATVESARPEIPKVVAARVEIGKTESDKTETDLHRKAS
jgi:uncharacterized protein YjbJ (UPF0337 family)